jgi:anti-anti-sigma factor
MVMNLITSAVDVGKPTVTLDLSGVTFIDSEGLAALLAAERLTDGAGMLLVLRSPSRRVMDLLLLSGLDCAFSIETTVVPLADADDST